MATVRWHTREDSGLRIDREQRWFHDDERIEHPRVLEAFNRGLRVEDDGRYTLHFGPDWAYVKVEGCAYAVVAVDESEGSRLSVRLSDRTAEWLDLESLSTDEDGVLTVKVKSGKASARFSRDAQFQMGQYLVEEDGHVMIVIGDTKIVIAPPLPQAGEGRGEGRT
jgi:hypothetical protein